MAAIPICLLFNIVYVDSMIGGVAYPRLFVFIKEKKHDEFGLHIYLCTAVCIIICVGVQ